MRVFPTSRGSDSESAAAVAGNLAGVLNHNISTSATSDQCLHVIMAGTMVQVHVECCRGYQPGYSSMNPMLAYITAIYTGPSSFYRLKVVMDLGFSRFQCHCVPPERYCMYQLVVHTCHVYLHMATMWRRMTTHILCF